MKTVTKQHTNKQPDEVLKIPKENLIHQIQKAKNGDQTAFSFLLDTFWSYIYGYQIKKTNSEEDAEDITIQTFSKAFEKINSFDENYTFKTWLVTISKNIYIDNYRNKKSPISVETTKIQEEKAKTIIDKKPTPEQEIILGENFARLLNDIKKLKPKYQTVINLRFFQELSYKEIALQTNEPINNIKVKLLRAKKLLAEIIDK